MLYWYTCHWQDFFQLLDALATSGARRLGRSGIVILFLLIDTQLVFFKVFISACIAL